MSYSAALFPVEPLILCRTVKARGRSLRGQPRRRMCRNVPKLLHPVEKCSSQFSANTMPRKSLSFVHAHVTHSSRLSHGKTEPHTRTAQQLSDGRKIQSLSPHTLSVSRSPFNLGLYAGHEHLALIFCGKRMTC